MRSSLKKALRIYKYVAVLFSVIYWIYIVIDDYGLIETYWPEHLLEYLGLWIVYFLIYLVGFSFYFWVAAIVIIFIDYRIIKQAQRRNDSV